jgi:hypothetical protein
LKKEEKRKREEKEAEVFTCKAASLHEYGGKQEELRLLQ